MLRTTQEDIPAERIVHLYEKDGVAWRLDRPPRWWLRNAVRRPHGRLGPQMMKLTEAQSLRDEEPRPWQWSTTKVRPWVKRDRNRAANRRARASRRSNR